MTKRTIKQKVQDANEKVLEEKKEYQEIVDKSFSEQFKDIKKELPNIVAEHKKELINHIQEYIKDHDLKVIPYPKLMELMSSGNRYNRTKYSADELWIAFNVYKSFMGDLSTKTKAIFPTKQSFCGFIGLSTQSLDSYKMSDDANLVEVYNQINDYLVDVQLGLAQQKIIDNSTTIFRMKAEHGLVETKAIEITTREVGIDLDSVQARMDKIKKARETAIEADFKEKE